MWITDFLACWAYMFRWSWRGFDNSDSLEPSCCTWCQLHEQSGNNKEVILLHSFTLFSGDIIIWSFPNPNANPFNSLVSSVLTLLIVSAWLSVNSSDLHPYLPSLSLVDVLDISWTREASRHRYSIHTLSLWLSVTSNIYPFGMHFTLCPACLLLSRLLLLSFSACNQHSWSFSECSIYFGIIYKAGLCV